MWSGISRGRPRRIPHRWGRAGSLVIAAVALALAACGATGTAAGGPPATAAAPTPPAASILSPTATATPRPLPSGWSAAHGVGAGYVPRIAIAPSEPATAYACIVSPNGKIVVSGTRDGGATWHSLGTPLAGSGSPCAITVNPTNAQDVVVDDGNSYRVTLARSRDGGRTWTEPSVGSLAFQSWGWVGSTIFVATTQVDSGSELTTLYASAGGGPFVRLDSNGKLGSITLHMVRYVGGTSATIYLQMGQIIQPISEITYASADGGKTWTAVTFHDEGQVVHLFVTTPDGHTLVGVYDKLPSQVAISTDAGHTWRKLPATPTTVPGFDWLMIAPDGTVVTTSSMFSTVTAPDPSVYEARTGDTHWRIAVVAPPDTYPGAIAWDSTGHPTQVWATHALDDRGTAWDLIMHRL